jgi:hypothetical protein
MQVFKKQVTEFIKDSKNVFDKIYKISEFNGGKSYYIYNGKLLKMDCFNIQFSLIYNKVNTSILKKDEVYTINEMDNENNIFNLFWAAK